MPTTTLTVGNEILSTTLYVLMKEIKDNLQVSTAFLDAHTRIHGAGAPVQAGGSRILQGLGFSEHSKTTEMRTGYERIDLSVSDSSLPAVYEWAHSMAPVVISSEEEMINQGDSAVLSILDQRAKAVASKLRREYVKQMVAGGVAGWSQWNTLNGIDHSGGFLEENAVGAQGNTVGGVSKTTYAAIPGWQNQVINGLNSFNANGLAALYDMSTEAAALGSKFNVWLASRAGFKNLKRALQAQERYVDKVADGGRLVQYWDGTQIDVEYYMPDDVVGGTATYPISFYGLNLEDIHMVWDPKGFFEPSDFERVSGEYDVRAAYIRCRGQLIAKSLGTSGLAHSLDTF
jgi:hypothetical protein